MERAIVGKRRQLVLALLLGLAANPADAVSAKWQDRGDRYEGIQPENVSGGDFQLLGVFVEPGPQVRGADRLWVSVPLRRTKELRLKVWEPESGYAMVPHRKTFEPGVAFSWKRAAVLEPQGIEAAQLYVLTTDPHESVYYPARLTTTAPTIRVTRYVFRFRSRGGVDLEETIAREEKGRLTEVVKRRREEDFGGIFDFTWDGSGAPGVYHLQLKGTLFLKSDRNLEIDIPFIHYGETAP